MILLSRLNGQQIALNADLIERAEATPDTVLTLVDGTKYVVAESVEDVIDRVRQYSAPSVLVARQAAGRKRRTTQGHVEGAPRPRPQPRRKLTWTQPASSASGLPSSASWSGMIMDGGNPAALIAPSSILLTFGGTIGAATAGMLMSDAKGLPAILKSALTAKVTAPDDAVAMVVSFRRKGPPPGPAGPRGGSPPDRRHLLAQGDRDGGRRRRIPRRYGTSWSRTLTP